MFWHCDGCTRESDCNLWIGWSIADSRARKVLSHGAWASTCEAREPAIEESGELEPVEEAVGVVFPEPSEFEIDVNDRVERLLADNLLVLLHRLFFGQPSAGSSEGWPHPQDGTVDSILVFGPALPKFVGRVCYTLLNRRKTVAIIAPRISSDQSPMERGEWEDRPYPALSDDSAVRRWRICPIGTPHEESYCEFTLIIPTGDGLAGRMPRGLKTGELLWRSKAEATKRLLREDRELVQLARWRGSPVYLPLGMKQAALSALLCPHQRRASTDVHELRSLTSDDFRAFEKLFGEAEAARGVPAAIRNMVLLRAWHDLIRRERRSPKHDTHRYMFEDAHAARKEEMNLAIQRAHKGIQKEIGEDAIQ